MRRSFAARLWRWIRAYFVASLLVGGLVVSCVRALNDDIEPRAQHPPPGYVLARTRAQLQWSAGTLDGEVRIQVSTSPGFDELLIDEVAPRNTRELRNLEPGTTYYWRLIKGDHLSDVAWFEVSPTALKYR
ncbi:MAG: hypothetical protein JRF63_05535 [Deltaproteobacteria bacterium]|nr:hypothetical protein [Deltaproteobacteria bacterium]